MPSLSGTEHLVFCLVGAVFALAGTALVLGFEELMMALKQQVSAINSTFVDWGVMEKSSDRMSVWEFLPDSLSPMESANTVARPVFGALGNFLVILFIGGFVSWNQQPYRRGIVSLFPKAKRDQIDAALLKAVTISATG